MSSWWRELNPGELAYLRRTSVEEADLPTQLSRLKPQSVTY